MHNHPVLDTFLNRTGELKRLDELVDRGGAGLAIVSGRRRIGKTRLLLEWVARRGGLYSVADASSPDIQRGYFAELLATRLPGFSDVAYPDWRSLLQRLARDARHLGWTGPLVLDELPYWLVAAPELATTLQHWIDHEAREAGLVIALAGSSQHLMQGLALAPNSPLFGRADEILELAPLDACWLQPALGLTTPRDVIEAHAAWGGVPRYWELAAQRKGQSTVDAIDHLVLDPHGPLHKEPDHLLIEELPPAIELRALLDAIGAGAHRVSEIAGRIGRPATSLSRALQRLISLGLVYREVPFGEPERRSKRSLYRLADPFFRLWFRVVAPHRALLASSPAVQRRALLAHFWPQLVAEAWEELCRRQLSKLADGSLQRLGPWGPAGRWWRGNAAEWDLIAQSSDGERLLLGEVKWKSTTLKPAEVAPLARALARRPAPALPTRFAEKDVVRALFLPALAADLPPTLDDVWLVSGAEVLAL